MGQILESNSWECVHPQELEVGVYPPGDDGAKWNCPWRGDAGGWPTRQRVDTQRTSVASSRRTGRDDRVRDRVCPGLFGAGGQC